MTGRMGGLLDRLWLRRWGGLAAPLAPETRHRLPDRAADRHLRVPVDGPSAMRQPLGTDWSWRPKLWQGPIPEPDLSDLSGRAEVCAGVTLFHDCPRQEVSLRQIGSQGVADQAPFAARIVVAHFEGSFLSLALDLPVEAAQGLKLRHLIWLDMRIETERPLEIFARLNIKHGPNVEQLVRSLPPGDAEAMVEFDLAYARVNEKRVERLWIDLIFQDPGMNRILLRDVTLGRRPRADF